MPLLWMEQMDKSIVINQSVLNGYAAFILHSTCCHGNRQSNLTVSETQHLALYQKCASIQQWYLWINKTIECK